MTGPGDPPSDAAAPPEPAPPPSEAASGPQPPRRSWRRALLAGILLGPLLVAGLVAAGLPPRDSVRALAKQAPERTRLMELRQAEARAEGRRYRVDRRWVPMKRISRALIAAVVAAEDANFFDHDGFDWEAIRDAASANWQRGRLARGGSTLSQQLVKNLFFSDEKSFLRKLREAIVTHWLEADLSKARILELYLNAVEWGDGVFGCQAAARRWYGVDCADLDAEQASGLAAMLPSPRRINPESSPRRFAQARDRVRRMLRDAEYVRSRVARLDAAGPADTAPDPLQ